MTFLFVASSVRRECGQRGHSGWHLPSHSQASSPRSVTLPQLPSPRIIPQSNKWRIVILKTPITMQGTFTPKSTPQVGRTGQPERRITRFLSSSRFGRRPVNRVARRQQESSMTKTNLAITVAETLLCAVVFAVGDGGRGNG